MLNENPTFSIVIPTYNRPELLFRAVRSVRSQTFRDFEIIVVDDGSDAHLAPRLRTDHRTRIIRHTVNKGAAAARNSGIASARGTFISFLDDDDEYLCSFLSETFARLRNTDSHVGASWCGVQCVQYADSFCDEPQVSVRDFSTCSGNTSSVMAEFLTIGTGFGVTLKKECLDVVGGFDESLVVTEDDDIFFRVVSAGFVPVVVPGVHVVLHDHRQSRLTDRSMHPSRIREAKRLLTNYGSFLELHPNIRQQVINNIEFLESEVALG